MTYFKTFAEVFDPGELVAAKASLPDPDRDRLPFALMDDRRFEILTYRLKCSEHGDRRRITLMQGTGERGRDVIVNHGDGRLAEIIQCKNLQRRLTAPALRSELLKLAFHAFLEPGILEEGGVAYELWCPGELSEVAAEVLGQWPMKWTDELVRSDAMEVLGEFARFRALTWEQTRAHVLERFPELLSPVHRGSVDLTLLCRENTSVYRHFFEGAVYMKEDDVETTIRKIFAEAGGYRELVDGDARHLLDRVASIPHEKRLATTSGYVMGMSPELVAVFTPDEFQQFIVHSTAPTSEILKLVITALARKSHEVAREFRETTNPRDRNVTSLLNQAMTTTLVSQVTRCIRFGGAPQPGTEAFLALDFEGRMKYGIRRLWDSYQRCLAGYDRAKHKYGSDEEFRHRIAKHCLIGVGNPEAFTRQCTEAIELHREELRTRFDAFCQLVPDGLLVVTDTVSAFDNKWLLDRMGDTLKILEKLRAGVD